MDSHILIAFTGALINIALSVTVPCLLQNSKQPFLKDIKDIFKLHRRVIITSSIIVGVTIYLALKFTPDVMPNFHELANLNPNNIYVSNNDSSDYNRPSMIIKRGYNPVYDQDYNSVYDQDYTTNNSKEVSPQLLNLIKLVR
jgi:hypothetical protein